MPRGGAAGKALWGAGLPEEPRCARSAPCGETGGTALPSGTAGSLLPSYALNVKETFSLSLTAGRAGLAFLWQKGVVLETFRVTMLQVGRDLSNDVLGYRAYRSSKIILPSISSGL